MENNDMASSDQYQQQQEYTNAMANVEAMTAEMSGCLDTILANIARLNALGKELKNHQQLYKAHWKHFNADKLNDIFEKSRNIDQHLFELKRP